VRPSANIKVPNTILLTANIGDIITQAGSTGNATVLSNVSATTALSVAINSGSFDFEAGNININGSDASVYVSDFPSISYPFAMRANVGQYITQVTTGANARVTSNVIYSTIIPVEFISNTFSIGSGNLKIDGGNLNAYPSNVVCRTDVTATYTDADTWDINSTLSTGIPKVHSGNVLASVSLTSNITALVGVGVTTSGLSTEGANGFDETKFDQGQLQLPSGLTIDQQTGWIIGQLPTQTIDRVNYDFEVISFKKDDATYQDSQLFRLTVLGDLNNKINWITDIDLGTITSGTVSDLSVEAVSTLGKTVVYSLSVNSSHRLPQGLVLTRNGLISGRVSFELFGLDSGVVTLDKDTTTFDQAYRFSVTATDLNGTIAASREFIIKVRAFTKIPYEDLYIKALPSLDQRALFSSIMTDTSIFPTDKIYRSEDPFFGVSKNIKSLFLPGLTPSELADYVQAASTNHFTKRFLFAGIKTAQVLDSNFDVKYEVVYLQLDSLNDIESSTFANIDEIGPPDTINLSSIIDNPYYDAEGNAFTTAYPNSTQNMESMIISQIGYTNKGALPDWMTSRQANGRQLGFNHAVVLAYTKPGESNLIAYRLKQRNFNFNAIDFTVDRYQLDNTLSANYDIGANAFVASSETTFDRFPSLSSTITDVGTVDYAVITPFEEINNRYINEIKSNGGLDGVQNIKDGQTLVFAIQEFSRNQGDIGDPDQGWANVSILWDNESWAYNIDTSDDDYGTFEVDRPSIIQPPATNADNTDTTLGEEWDSADYVPGFEEHLLNSAIANQRAGIWQINVVNSLVTLSFIQEVEYYNKVYVRNGFSYGGTNIYYDPIVKTGNNVPNYSVIPEQISAPASLRAVLGTGDRAGQVVAIRIISGGTGYKTTPPPTIKFVGDGTGASAQAQILNGTIAGVVITSAGSGYSIAPTVIVPVYTTFDGNGTRFFDNRDEYTLPESGDKYIKFTKLGVFT
jgi:hypothetical protein